MIKKLKNLGKIIAAFVMSFALLVPLAACSPSAGGHTHTDTDGDGVCDSCHQQIDDTADGDKKDDDTPKDPTGPVNIYESAGDLEACYALWTEVTGGAKSYNVYVKPENGSYTKIDKELVRKYPTYYRADAVGLAAGNYTIKVVPVGSDGNERENLADTKDVTVEAHERTGFAFVGGTSSGAYNNDGTLRDDARVIYITQNTKNTVELEVVTGNKGATTNCVGLLNILLGYKKQYDNRPLCVRLIGNITDLEVMDKGDIAINGIVAGITFEGIGNDATANGWGLRIKGSKNVEVRNLGFMNCNSEEGDNITLQDVNDHVWVHNCDMFYGDAGTSKDQKKGDGALDTKLSSYVTHSYNHFWDSGKCNLMGMKDEKTTNYITYHHNWYDHSDSRHPRIRTCTVHIYNNYFDGNSKYGVGVTSGASAFVENNYFRSNASMRPMLSSQQGTDALGDGTFGDETGGIIKAYGNEFNGTGRVHLLTQNDTTADNIDCYLAKTRDENVPATYATKVGGNTYNNFDTDSSIMYTYTVDTPEKAKEKIEKWAGRIGGGDLKWEFDNDKEDGNYDVIDELKDKLTNYSSTLLEIGGEEVKEVGGSTGGTGDGSGGSEITEIEEDTTYTPSVDGYTGKYGIVVSGGSAFSKSKAVVINGVSIDAGKALKMESATTVKFTLKQEMTVTLYLYLANDAIKVDGTKCTATAHNDGYYVYTAKLAAGEHTVIKNGGDTALYMLTLTK